MSLGSGLSGRVGAFVHAAAAADPAAFALHRSIIATRLTLGMLALAAAPLYLLAAGAPPPAAAVSFFWLVTPLASAGLLSRRGRVAESQALTAACLIGLGLTLGLSKSPAASAAFVPLVLAPLEAALALDFTVALACGAIACAAAVGLAAFGEAETSAGAEAPLAAVILGACGVAYAAQLAWRVLAIIRRRDQMQKVGAAHLAGLSEALGDLVMRHDRSGAVLAASDEARTLFGLTPRDLMGRGFFERIHVADRPAFLSSVADAAAGDRTVSATLRLRVALGDGREDPTFAWVELRARRLANVAAPREAEVVSVVRDVSAMKRHERDIEEARIEAERAAAWKDRFLANVSHELRTPLNGIIGFSEMLCSEELSPRDPAKQREYAKIISSSGQHLLSVVNSILDMSKIEAGRFDIVPEPFEIAPLIDSCCDILRLKAEQGEVLIEQACAPGLPELVADKRACKQMLINLLSNAVKFTPRGGRIAVGARVEGNSIALFVCDSGIGIGASDLPHIGSAFYQARGAYDRPFEGTGLGLSVVRGLVGLHGGAIALESAPGEGTCVTIRLPREGKPGQVAAAPARIDVISRAARSAPAAPAACPPPLTMVKKIA